MRDQVSTIFAHFASKIRAGSFKIQSLSPLSLVDLNVSYAFVTVKLQNHAAKGVTDKDFELARKIVDVVMWQPALDEQGALEATLRSFNHYPNRNGSRASINLETAVERPVQCDPLGAGQGAARTICAILQTAIERTRAEVRSPFTNS